MKKFFIKDLSGRGYTSKQTLSDLLEWENEESYNEEMLHEWAENAEEGDEWRTNSLLITCIES